MPDLHSGDVTDPITPPSDDDELENSLCRMMMQFFLAYLGTVILAWHLGMDLSNDGGRTDASVQ